MWRAFDREVYERDYSCTEEAFRRIGYIYKKIYLSTRHLYAKSPNIALIRKYESWSF